MSIGISSELLYAQMQKSKNDSKAIGLQNKLTGLDLRRFDHAIVFKVALMVRKYLSSRETR